MGLKTYLAPYTATANALGMSEEAFFVQELIKYQGGQPSTVIDAIRAAAFSASDSAVVTQVDQLKTGAGVVLLVSPGGAINDIQVNDGAGGFAGFSGLQWDNTNRRLNVTDANSSVAIGPGVNQGTGGAGVVIGTNASVPGNGGSVVVIGQNASAQNSSSVVVGQAASGTGGGVTVIGSNASGTAASSTAVGTGAQAGSQGTAVGQGAQAGSQGTALGQGAIASGSASTALGTSASASTANQVALGSSSAIVTVAGKIGKTTAVAVALPTTVPFTGDIITATSPTTTAWTSSIDAVGRFLYDNSLQEAVNWASRTMRDSLGFVTIDWEGRTLGNGLGTIVNWNADNLLVILKTLDMSGNDITNATSVGNAPGVGDFLVIADGGDAIVTVDTGPGQVKLYNSVTSQPGGVLVSSADATGNPKDAGINSGQVTIKTANTNTAIPGNVKIELGTDTGGGRGVVHIDDFVIYTPAPGGGVNQGDGASLFFDPELGQNLGAFAGESATGNGGLATFHAGNSSGGNGNGGTIEVSGGSGNGTGNGGDVRLIPGQGGGSGLVGFVSVEGAMKLQAGSTGRAGTAILIGGTVTVSNLTITATSQVFVTSQIDGGTPGFLRVNNKIVGTSFDIVSSSVTDTSTVAFMIIDL